MELEWKPQYELSYLNFAWCLSHSPDRLSHAQGDIREAAEQLVDCIRKIAGSHQNHEDESIWETLLCLSPDEPSNSRLADRIQQKMRGRTDPHLTIELASHLDALRKAYAATHGNRADCEGEIQLRQGPLQQQWETYGPGLLRQIGSQTTEELIVERARVYLVKPSIGGAGYAHLSRNAVHFEAILTNPTDGLPEVVRLAWLLSQLDLERPVFSDGINRFRLRLIAGFAMLPATLLAAAELGLIADGKTAAAEALAQWHGDVVDGNRIAKAEILWAWWETYQATRLKWSTALVGLNRMLTLG